MMTITKRTRTLLPFLALAASACASVQGEQPAAAAAAAASAASAITLYTSAGEDFPVSVYAPRSAPRAAILFSHGGGSWPERYRPFVDLLTAEGFVVLAPTHADSMKRAKPIAFNKPEAFQARIAELQAAGAYARTTFALPVGAVGHSYGSLFAAMAGGALENTAPGRIPGIGAVLALSTPGIIPGLVTPGAYRTLDVPYMLVTGGKDIIPGFLTDPADHLVAYKEASGRSGFAVIVEDGDHELVAAATPQAAAARRLAIAFLKAELLRHPASTKMLAQTPRAGVQLLRRPAQ
jgi:alpha-beta hydrolase superfamily lysophospholipase